MAVQLIRRGNGHRVGQAGHRRWNCNNAATHRPPAGHAAPSTQCTSSSPAYADLLGISHTGDVRWGDGANRTETPQCAPTAHLTVTPKGASGGLPCLNGNGIDDPRHDQGGFRGALLAASELQKFVLSPAVHLLTR